MIWRLAKKYKFGYYDENDLFQEGWLIALDGLERYDHSRPLENFMITHLKNRFLNFKRNKYRRNELPCKCCPQENKEPCEKYKKWLERNNVKKNLMYPNVITESNFNVPDPHQNPEYDIYTKEMVEKIDKLLEGNLRSDYLRLKAGEKLSKNREEKVLERIKEILKE